MEKERRRRRKKQILPARKPPTTVNDVPDSLMKLIIDLLKSHVCFIRAAAVCTRWRRIASTRSITLRDWYRHDFNSCIGYYHIVDPTFSSPPGSQPDRALRRRVVFVPALPLPSINARHFSLDFLPKGYMFWCIEDDGTVFGCEDRWCSFLQFRVPEHVRGLSCHQSMFRFVDDGQYYSRRRVLVASLINGELRVFEQHKDNEGRSDWVLKKSLDLQEATRGFPGRKDCYFNHTAKIVTAGNGYIVLTPAEETWLFSVELRTMRVEREHSRNRLPGETYPYVLDTKPVSA
ncbi:hypothetical protein QOZ80_6AG0532120 [Eleusine coracana subsp. coracana]|nr:hypothetical protein QOZ80_6AG0532120 [Eleusine coracana subsp. coracana]